MKLAIFREFPRKNSDCFWQFAILRENFYVHKTYNFALFIP